MIETPYTPLELPLIGATRERSDAARNRRRIVAAAERLFARDGVGCTSMDAIAAEAGVGKGTLFRRFGDRASLARAVMSERERAFQEELIRGAPPIGPGAPPCERVVAFGSAMLDMLERHGELLLAAEAGVPGAYLRSPAWTLYHVHLASLLRPLAPELDADLSADALLAGLTASVFLHQRRGRGESLERLKRNWEAFARRLLGVRRREA